MAYEPHSIESSIYRRWERSGFFNPDKLPGARKKSFSIAMPPPNVTGDLHIGHALTITLEDVITRYHRMLGDDTVWIPGTDHAGIATQVRVERLLAEQGISRHEVGRELFLKHVWAWKKKYGDTITGQIRALGASCDWSREHFTMDPNLTAAVHEAFIRLFNDGRIYRSTRIIHWCPNDRTALSDLEVKHEERVGSLWHIKYKVKDAPHYVTVATTRPETLYGDTAIAVNPNDERYANIIGRTVLVPLIGREIQVIADKRVEPEFGTGAVKVTPAHDFLDAQIGQTHKLLAITVIGPDGRMLPEAGADLAGMPIHEARLLTVEALNREGLLEKTEDYRGSVTVCDRCGTAIEPQISQQWFVNMKPLVKPAIAAVRTGKISILPKRFEKNYFHWMENIQDWCISRQLWWGHRIPVWYCNDCNTAVASAAKPVKACAKCKGKKFQQDEDVLDTWFSSALWTFSTLGWPKNQKGKVKKGDLKRFHPTAVMETGWDILTFWVSRMVTMSLYLTGEVPFKTVYLNGLVLDKQGKKMSKSKGTGVDPLLMTQKYGTDALRLSLIIGQTVGQDFRMFEEKIAGQRNFINKIWNIGQYIKQQEASAKGRKSNMVYRTSARQESLADKWIQSRLATTTARVTKAIETYDFSLAGQALTDFVWHDLADWYVEIHKVEQNTAVLRQVFAQTLVLLHPMAPFITEELWTQLGFARSQKDLLMIQPWPKAGKPAAAHEKSFSELQRAVTALRVFERHGGLKKDEPAATNSPHRALIEKLTGFTLSASREKLSTISLAGVAYWFPAERTSAFEAWRTAERKNLTGYATRLRDQLKNSKLPPAVRQQLEYKLADAKHQLAAL